MFILTVLSMPLLLLLRRTNATAAKEETHYFGAE
jgi:hypothetical protein